MKSFIEKVKDMASIIYYKESNKYAIDNLTESKEILSQLRKRLIEEEN